MRWLLDDGPFGHLAGLVELEAVNRWTAGYLGVASQTAVDHRKRSPQGKALLDLRSADGADVIAVASIRFGTDDPAADVLSELHRNGVGTTDLAEREAIAWALAHGPGTVFIAADKRAVLTALAELGVGRVGHAFDVWIDLLRREWIDVDTFARLCERTRRHDQGLERMPDRVSELLPP